MPTIWGTAAFVAAPAKGGHISHVHWAATGDGIRSASGSRQGRHSGQRRQTSGSAPPHRPRNCNVVGARIRLGDANKRIDLRTDGSAVDLHSETHELWIRTLGDAAHPGQRNVLINPSPQEGNVGIGTTTPAAKLHVSGNMQLNGNAVCRAGGFWVVSDARQKTNVRPIEKPLAGLCSIPGVRFDWRRCRRTGLARAVSLGSWPRTSRPSSRRRLPTHRPARRRSTSRQCKRLSSKRCASWRAVARRWNGARRPAANRAPRPAAEDRRPAPRPRRKGNKKAARPGGRRRFKRGMSGDARSPDDPAPACGLPRRR